MNEELYGILVDPETGEIVSQPEPVPETVTEPEVNSVLARMRKMDAGIAGLQASIEYESKAIDATLGVRKRRLESVRKWLEGQWKPVLEQFAKRAIKGSKTWLGDGGKLSFRAYKGSIITKDEPTIAQVFEWNAANGFSECNQRELVFNMTGIEARSPELAKQIEDLWIKAQLGFPGKPVLMGLQVALMTPENQARLFSFAEAVAAADPFDPQADMAIAEGLGFKPTDRLGIVPPYEIEPPHDRFYVSTK